MRSDERQREAKPLRILILCPQRLVRDGLRLLAEEDAGVSVAGSAESLQDVEEHPPDRSPDVIVVVEGWNGRACTPEVRGLKATDPEAAVLVISSSVESAHIQNVIAAGATAFVPLTVGLDYTFPRGWYANLPPVGPRALPRAGSRRPPRLPVRSTGEKLPSRRARARTGWGPGGRDLVGFGRQPRPRPVPGAHLLRGGQPGVGGGPLPRGWPRRFAVRSLERGGPGLCPSQGELLTPPSRNLDLHRSEQNRYVSPPTSTADASSGTRIPHTGSRYGPFGFVR